MEQEKDEGVGFLKSLALALFKHKQIVLDILEDSKCMAENFHYF